MIKRIFYLFIFGLLFSTFGCFGIEGNKPISDNELMELAESSAADAKVSALVELAATPADGDTLYIIDDTTSKKITVANLLGGAEGTLTNEAGLYAALSDVTNFLQEADLSANGFSLVTAADYAAMKVLLDLEIGTDIEAFDAAITKSDETETISVKWTFDDNIFILESAAADADVAGDGQLWVKNDAPNTLWFTNDAGTDFQLGVGSMTYPGAGIPLSTGSAWDTSYSIATLGAALEADMILSNMQGAVTDGQVPNDITIDLATLGTSITVTANNSTDETVYPAFFDGATGTQGAETDTGWTYNPSSGNMTIAGVFTATGGFKSGPTATPSMTLEDSDDAAGTGEINANSSGGANDIILSIGVEDSTGEDTPYIEVDGVTETIDMLKPTTLQAGDIITADLADDAVSADKIAHTAVTPGSYTFSAITVDQQGRITAASSGSPGAETNSLETTITGILTTEIPIGTAADTVVYAAISGQSSMTNGGVMTNNAVTLDDETSIEIMADHDGMDDDEYNGITVTGLNAGEGLTQWNLVRIHNDADPWHLAEADVASEFPAQGIVVATVTDTNEAKVLVQGVVRNEGWTGLTIGGAVYLGEASAGSLTQTAPSTAGDCVQIVGFAISDSEILFDFSRPYQEVE